MMPKEKCQTAHEEWEVLQKMRQLKLETLPKALAGLLRKDEAKKVKARPETHIPGLQLTVLDAAAGFYQEPEAVTEPEKKRMTIGWLFIEHFVKAAKEVGIDSEKCMLLQGTLYPDAIQSTSFRGPFSVITKHHNVGGLPNRKKTFIEPLRLDEVRLLCRELGPLARCRPRRSRRRRRCST